MNANLLNLGSDVSYLRGTERVPAIVVGLSPFPDCIALLRVLWPYPVLL